MDHLYSFLKLQLTRECIISWMYYNFGQIGPQTTELVAFEHQKIPLFGYIGENGVYINLLENYPKYFITILDGSQVSDPCPLGYLFILLVNKDD